MFTRKICTVSVVLLLASFHCVRLHAQATPGTDPPAKSKGTPTTKASRTLTGGAQLFEVQFGVNLEGLPTGDIRVIEVRPETRAAHAGVKKGDVVIAIEGTPLRNSTDLASYVAEHEVSSSVALTLRRDGKTLDVLIGDHFTGLGMTVRQDKSKRAYVWTLIPNSSAAAAGIHVGDLFLAIGDRKTATYSEFVKQLSEVLASTMAGDEIPLLVIREGREGKLTLLRPDNVDLPPSKEVKEKEVPVAAGPRPERIGKAIAVFHAPVTAQPAQTAATPPVGGVALFVPGLELIEVRLELSGLPPGQYLATIHEFGDTADIMQGSAGAVLGSQKSSTPVGQVGSFQPDVNGNVVWSSGLRTSEIESLLGRAILISRVTATPNGPQYATVGSGVIGIANHARDLLVRP